MAEELSGEERLIARYFRPLAKHPAALGLLDDAAALEPPAGCDLVLKTDGLIGGVHFFLTIPRMRWLGRPCVPIFPTLLPKAPVHLAFFSRLRCRAKLARRGLRRSREGSATTPSFFDARCWEVIPTARPVRSRSRLPQSARSLMARWCGGAGPGRETGWW